MFTADMDWGLAGALAHAGQSATLVVVDVLSFSTSVDVAVGRGAEVFPFAFHDRAAAGAFARERGAALAGSRDDPAFQFSLSPVSLSSLSPGSRLVLPSPNGSAISAAVVGMPVFAGCLRNARAVAEAAHASAKGGPVTVIAASEHWPYGSFRPAIEDLLGAGAILSYLAGPLSPEAIVARDAYRSAGNGMPALIRGSVSGRELIDRGWSWDVDAALAENVSAMAPILRDGRFMAQHVL